MNDTLVLRRSIAQTLELHWLRILVFSFVAHAFGVAGLMVTPLEPETMSADLFESPNRFASLVLTERRRPGLEAKDCFTRVTIPTEKVTLPNLRAKKDGPSAGVFAALSGEAGGVSHVFGLGGLGGSVVRHAGGSGGMGTRGVGAVGGGSIGTIGIGSKGAVGSGVAYGRGTGSAGVARRSVAAKVSPPVVMGSRGVARGAPAMKAGRHDDNKQYNRFLAFLRDNRGLVKYPVKVGERLVLETRDENDRSLHNCLVRIADAAGKELATRATYADGSTQFFPRALGASSDYQVVATCAGKTRHATVVREGARTTALRFGFARALPEQVPVDIAVVLDTTGSMQSQIDRLKRTLGAIHTQLTALPTQPDIRFALVAYRDEGDTYVTRKVGFTRDVDAFQRELRRVQANGGGDTPEDLQEALRVAMRELTWREDAVRLGFVVADAPPHTDYGQSYTYRSAMREALRRGIKWSTVGAGGLRRDGEVIFRQIAQHTRGEYVFVTQGHRADAEGGAGEASHHIGTNYRVENLDQAVVRIVRRELSYLSDTPRDFDDTIVASSSSSTVPRDKVMVPAVREAMRQLTDYASIRLETGTPTAVVPMASPGEEHREVTEYLVEQMTLAASRQDVFQVVERDLRALAQEHRWQLSDLFDVESSVPFGKLVGAELLIISRLTVRGDRAELYAKLVRVETGEVLSAARVSFQNGVITLARAP